MLIVLNDEIRKLLKEVYVEGYSKGHQDTVDGSDYYPEESADEYIKDYIDDRTKIYE